MKKIIYSLLFSLISLPVYSQVVAIQNDRQNVLYIGYDNLLTISVNDCPQDTMIVACEHGEVVQRKDNDQNHYAVYVDSPGVAIITVKKKVGKSYTLLDSRRFHIEYLPDPTPLYARRMGGKISMAEMNEDFAPFAKLPDFEPSPKYVIDSFTVMVVRGDQMTFMKRQAGGRKMDDATLAFFKTLRENDKLLFTDITCKAPDKRMLHLHAMEFVIKNITVTVNGEDK